MQNLVLLSGGSGKRLWPLSNDSQSKQFLRLLKNAQGDSESMVQRVMRQIDEALPEANIYISSNVSQADTIQHQLGDVETVFEPSRRDTFPAIALAAAHLHYKKDLDQQEVFVVCPIDVFAENRYFELLESVAQPVKAKQAKIGLLGVVPTYPSAKYGYILRDEEAVIGFVEKPDEESAARLLEKGALWNCGVFALRIDYVLEQAAQYIDFDSFETFYEQFNKLPAISFDYEVVENEPNIAVVTYEGVWKDLGTWNTLTEEMAERSVGKNIIVSENCDNTHVLNMLDIPIIVQDLQDAVVVASYDGVLVSSKKGSSYLKPLTEQVDLRPMYEQRRWGNYRVLSYHRTDDSSVLVKRMHIDAGQAISYQYHKMRSETWTIVSGRGALTVDDESSEVGLGYVVHIPKGIRHKIVALSDLDFIEVQFCEGEIDEDDVFRITE